jgi:hypothetical protein
LTAQATLPWSIAGAKATAVLISSQGHTHRDLYGQQVLDQHWWWYEDLCTYLLSPQLRITSPSSWSYVWLQSYRLIVFLALSVSTTANCRTFILLPRAPRRRRAAELPGPDFGQWSWAPRAPRRQWTEELPAPNNGRSSLHTHRDLWLLLINDRSRLQWLDAFTMILQFKGVVRIGEVLEREAW